MLVRIAFHDKDSVETEVPDVFVRQAQQMVAQGSMEVEDVRRLLLEFDFLNGMSNEDKERYQGAAIVVYEGSIVYAARELEEVLAALNDQPFDHPALVATVPRREKSTVSDPFSATAAQALS